MRMLGCCRWMLVLAVILCAAPVSARAGAAEGAEAAEVATTGQLRRWVVGLMDADPAVRDESRMALMGLGREALPTLAAIVRELRPLEPPFEETLRDVVRHVYLSGEAYLSEDRGFLGISMPARIDAGTRMDVVIESRMPGFVGYRMLQDGDVVLDIEEFPLGQPVERAVFCDVIRAIRPGRLVHLKVLRRGQILRIPIRLDPRPRDTSGVPSEYESHVQVLTAQRLRAAEQFWKTFAAASAADEKGVEKTATVEQK